MAVSRFRGVDFGYCQGGQFHRVVPVVSMPVTPPVEVPPDPVGGSFIADTLTTSNTGVPSGTSLTTLTGSRSFTSADNNTTQTAKKYVGRVTLSGVNNITFTNCEFTLSDADPDGYALVMFDNTQRSGTNTVTFNYCTFRGPASAVVDCVAVFYSQNATLNRCLFERFDNAIRMEKNTTVAECLFRIPTQLAGAHVDGIELYAQNGNQSNMEIRDSAFYMGPPNDWASGGGVTCAINCTSDYGDNDDIRIYRNLLLGGAYVAYLRDHPSTAGVNVPTNIEFIGNRVGSSNAGFPHVTVRLTDVATLEKWYDNFEYGTGTRCYIPGLGTERT